MCEPMTDRPKATLVLEDGTTFRGRSFGATGEVAAEIIFHTGMTGYQEVLTDPSYCGQMVIMTYPLIGNYGINELDEESSKPQVAGFIVKELSPIASNWRSEESLHDYLARYGILGIEGIDTRAAVLHLRTKGAMRAVISTERHNSAELQRAALASPTMEGQNLVTRVTSSEPYDYHENPKISELNSVIGEATEDDHDEPPPSNRRYRVIAYDFGVKRNILDLLAHENMDVTVVPASATAEQVMAMKPDGLFLSNGPGDPATLEEIAGELRKMIGKIPTFGICLGHQLLGLAVGGKTFKLKFGHHGANHPVKDMLTGKVEITSQNHGFCVDMNSLPATCKVTHVNLNDNTVEGVEDQEQKFFAVQYHPEAAPGPHDSSYLFRRFREMIERG